MLVYTVENKYLHSNVSYDTWQEAIEDVQMFFTEGTIDDQRHITITTIEMSRKDFETLPEFEGY